MAKKLKYGKIGAPHSAKRKLWLKHIRPKGKATRGRRKSR